MIRSIVVAAARSDSVGTGQADRLASPDAAGALVALMVAPGSAVMGSILTSADIRAPTADYGRLTGAPIRSAYRCIDGR